MDKNELISNLTGIESSLKEIQQILRSSNKDQEPKQNLKSKTEKTSLLWFEKIEPQLKTIGISDDILKKYHENFDRLLRLSMSRSRNKSYSETINKIIPNFKSEIVVDAKKFTVEIKQFNQLNTILENLDEKEKEYFEEALGCANHGYKRASIVLGWSATIHRIHKIVEKLGFDIFNEKSREMKQITEGRYKRFSKTFSVHNLSELQSTVFDKDLLWVLEYWELIDSNQHERLSICFTMRNNSGHPGDATISEENLLSFYSDIKNIIFDNERFSL